MKICFVISNHVAQTVLLDQTWSCFRTYMKIGPVSTAFDINFQSFSSRKFKDVSSIEIIYDSETISLPTEWSVYLMTIWNSDETSQRTLDSHGFVSGLLTHTKDLDWYVEHPVDPEKMDEWPEFTPAEILFHQDGMRFRMHNCLHLKKGLFLSKWGCLDARYSLQVYVSF